MIEGLEIENLTPFMQVLILYDMIDDWVKIPIKTDNTIHGFNWDLTNNYDKWEILEMALHHLDLKDEYENPKKYLDSEHKLRHNNHYTSVYENVELTEYEIRNIHEIKNSFPEYQI